MYTKEDIEKAKQYLDGEGYGTGNNFSLNVVANLMAEYAAKNCVIPAVSNCPSELEPVLAKIEHINSLGKSSWYEVVYFDKYWRGYAGSVTFRDGEKVVKWRYCKDCC